MRHLGKHGKRLLVLTFGCALIGMPLSAEAWQGPGEFDPSGGEILTQGPVHEAFAEPVVFDPVESPLIPKEPPPPVEELPPDQRPEGQDVQWISGYWAWDDSRGDFLWISGIWRDVPPGTPVGARLLEPGQGGFQWVPGTWAALDQEEAEYLPAPPESLEMGPSSPAPSADVTWAPGCWYYQEERYVWRPGYWVPVQEEWLWVPAHYVWSPYGYIFVEGYWDRPIVQRGLVFAPVYFQQPVYRQPNFVYTPTIGIVATALISNLFVRPSYNQYYFGDYYAPNYAQAGIVPWYSFHQSRRGYDPIYSYYASANRNNPRWRDELHQQYEYRREHVDARPPRTFVQQQRVNIRQKNVTNVTTINNIITNNNVEIGRPIGQFAANPRGGRRFERVTEDRRREIRTRQVAQREFRERRASLESRANQARSPGEGRPRRVERLRSPIASRAQQDPGRGGPPPRPTVSRPDPAARPRGPGQVRRGGNPDPDRGPRRPGGPDGDRPGRPDGLGRPGGPDGDRPDRPGLDRSTAWAPRRARWARASGWARRRPPRASRRARRRPPQSPRPRSTRASRWARWRPSQSPRPRPARASRWAGWAWTRSRRGGPARGDRPNRPGLDRPRPSAARGLDGPRPGRPGGLGDRPGRPDGPGPGAAARPDGPDVDRPGRPGGLGGDGPGRPGRPDGPGPGAAARPGGDRPGAPWPGWSPSRRARRRPSRAAPMHRKRLPGPMVLGRAARTPPGRVGPVPRPTGIPIDPRPTSPD